MSPIPIPASRRETSVSTARWGRVLAPGSGPRDRRRYDSFFPFSILYNAKLVLIIADHILLGN